jgi:hypothetical protein
MSEVETRAREMGWVPETEFHGDKTRWLDAEAYVKRGEEFIPFLRANNRKQEAEISSLKAKIEEQNKLLRANTAALTELAEANNATTREAVEESRRDIIGKLAEARREGDTETEITLTDQLEETNEKLRAAKTDSLKGPNGSVIQSPTAVGATGEDFTQRTEWKEFVAREPWVKEDPVMLAAANAIMIKMIADGEMTDLTPAQRFNKVAQATKKRFGISENPRREEPTRVEGTRSSGEGSNNNEGNDYDSLPADARAACDKQAKDPRLVGKGKKYPDIAAYRKYYAKMYNGE